jgi:hypothetical protein
MSTYHWMLLVMSSVLNVVYVIPYTYGIVHGKIRPNCVSWFLWLLLGVISLVVVLKAGGRHEAVFNFFTVLGEALIFLLALRKGDGGFTKWNAIALLGGGLSLMCLFVLADPLWTLLAVIGTDLFGFIPTWAKSWHDPASESLLAYTIAFGACLCGVLVASDGVLIYYLYPLSLMIWNGILVAILLHRNKGALLVETLEARS